jgi:formylglycine-generating enzyme required for sulfatase activity
MTPHIITILSHSFTLLPVPGTEPDKPFMMGRSDDDPIEEDWEKDQKPAHPVHITGFYMGEYPVTQALWRAVVEADCPSFGQADQEKLNPEPSGFQGDMRPVEQVSWNDVQVFLKKLNLLTDESRPANTRYRLPTEAEWEYAARGAPCSEGYRYAGSDKLSETGWFDVNSDGETHEVGLLMPNELGLYDMSGNAWEWCEDWFGSGYYQKCLKKGPIWNPKGQDKGSSRVVRGGSWSNSAPYCRAACRSSRTPNDRWPYYGFRVVLAPQSVG